MVYHDNVACAIRVNGIPLREKMTGDMISGKTSTVFVRPDVDYSIYIRNKNNYRIYANILIDGMSIGPHKYIIEANGEIDIKRFMLDGNEERGKTFRTAKPKNTQDPDNIHLGKIQIEIYGGCTATWTTVPNYTYYTTFDPNDTYYTTSDWSYSTNSYTYQPSSYCVNTSSVKSSLGTIEGVDNDQKFKKEYNSDVMFFPLMSFTYLLKEIDENCVKYCGYCGNMICSDHNYCTKCGSKV